MLSTYVVTIMYQTLNIVHSSAQLSSIVVKYFSILPYRIRFAGKTMKRNFSDRSFLLHQESEQHRYYFKKNECSIFFMYIFVILFDNNWWHEKCGLYSLPLVIRDTTLGFANYFFVSIIFKFCCWLLLSN